MLKLAAIAKFAFSRGELVVRSTGRTQGQSISRTAEIAALVLATLFLVLELPASSSAAGSAVTAVVAVVAIISPFCCVVVWVVTL